MVLFWYTMYTIGTFSWCHLKARSLFKIFITILFWKSLPRVMSYLVPSGFLKKWKISYTSLEWVNWRSLRPIILTFSLVVKGQYWVSKVTFPPILFIMWSPMSMLYYPIPTRSGVIFVHFYLSILEKGTCSSYPFIVSIYPYLCKFIYSKNSSFT